MESLLGQILLVPYDFAPHGWAFCHGQRMSIRQNEALFNLLGKAYGRDGDYFNLPDLRGRVPIGAGQGPGLTAYALGQAQGDETVRLTVAQMPSHGHGIQASTGDAGSVSPVDGYLVATDTQNYTADGPFAAMGDKMATTTGGSSAHPNIQPYLALNYIICLFGEYPAKG